VERSFDEVLCELDAGAARLGPGAEGLVLVPYLNGVMNPYWDDDASGVLAGLRGHHQAAHVFRAIVEGIAFEQRLHTRGVEAVVGEVSELVVMGGGSKSAMWCQILADVLGRPIQRAATSEATALGAAILAAPTSGMHPDVPAACGAMTRLAERFEPGDDAPRYDALYCEVYEGLYLDVQQRMQRLARLT
jgi:xylulokinase